MNLLVYTLPFIAALTGWVTNYIAVKMLFHPKKKIKILFFSIQGIFPKRKDKLAEKLGKIVSSELFSIQDIEHLLKSPETVASSKEVVEKRIDRYFETQLNQAMPMLSMFLSADLKDKIKSSLLIELDSAIPDILDTYTERIKQQMNVEDIVYQKVTNFSSDKLEEILYSIMSKEFRFIEILGGVLGFIIGLIQLLLVMIK
jgi:uncharacterized membrane protein YheB (UPF0754 family)